MLQKTYGALVTGNNYAAGGIKYFHAANILKINAASEVLVF
jgi:hypothetical protein